MRSGLTGVILALAAFCMAFSSAAVEISNRYRSPRNPERKVRSSTELIVLHTTEAPARSSLNKLSDRGEAHFCVTEEGSVYRIVDRDREAFHAGRSMWNGREDVDKFSIGIECVGYHNKPMSSVQLRAIRELVEDLQRMYRIPDERVVCHSHVAYGSPNKWQRRRHRGRKRCGMLFAMPSVRRILGLKSRPAFDVDTRAGRLTVGDDYLRQVLYGSVDTMVGRCGAGSAVAAAPSSSGSWLSSIFRSSKPAASPAPPPSPPPPPPRAAISRKPIAKRTPPVRAAPAKAPAKGQAAKQTAPTSVAELQAQGFVLRGTVTKANSASRIAGSKWNAPDTYYTIRDKVIPGSAIDAAHIEKGMRVWTRK